MTDEEALSRMLSGDLEPEAEARIRARIEVEPDLREAWQVMQALPEAIAELPHPEFSEAWVDLALASEPTSRGWPWWVAGWAAAAASLLLHLAPGPPPLHLSQGTAVVMGSGRVAVADRELAVDGQAAIVIDEVLRVEVLEGEAVWVDNNDLLRKGQIWRGEIRDEAPLVRATSPQLPLFSRSDEPAPSPAPVEVQRNNPILPIYDDTRKLRAALTEG